MLGWQKGNGRRSGLVFTPGSHEVIQRAQEEALRKHHKLIGVGHILLGIARAAGEVLEAAGADPAAVARELEALSTPEGGRPTLTPPPYSALAKRVLEVAIEEAYASGDPEVRPSHLLAGCVRCAETVTAGVLRKHGLDEVALRNAAHAPPAGRTRLRVVLDDSSTRSIYEQIVEQIREAIATGALAAGERLPTVRQLADELDVAPGTVARAYGELERVMLVKSEGSRGTRVAERTPPPAPSGERYDNLVGLLRPVAVAAFHLGATAPELRGAMEEAMRPIFPEPGGEAV